MMADTLSRITGVVDLQNVATVVETDKHVVDDTTVAEEAGILDIQERLVILEEKILTWGNDQDTSQGNPEEGFELLEYVNEVRQLEEILRTVEFTNEEDEQNNVLKCAQSILQMTTERLLQEFIARLGQFHHEFSHLIQNQPNPELVGMTFRSASDEDVDFFSNSSFGDEPADNGSHSFTNNGQGANPIDIIFSSTISKLKSIATLLFQCNYGNECCQAYICARKVALEDSLLILWMEPFGIEEVLKMEWNKLNHTINLWKNSIKVFVRVYLAGDKRLCDLIFRDILGSMGQFCFADTSKCSVFQLLSFADAVAISTAKPEKLFQLLDIYEILDSLRIDIENFFPEDHGLSISDECHRVRSRLSDSIKITMNVFKWEIQTHTSTAAFPRAGVHQITNYVMNYMKALASYNKTINFLLSDQPDNNGLPASENLEENRSDLLCCPFSLFLKSATMLLESNLDAKSRLYNNDAMLNVFMMNNKFYIVQKIKGSDLCHFVTDEWIRAHIAKYQQHARDYQRASWTSVISYLIGEGNQNSGRLSRKVIKQRFKGFNNAFEEVYRTQTGWLVPNEGLREDLRISISPVLQAYRVFLSRHADHLERKKHREKYIKYSADDLEKYLLDLFEGSEKSLHYPWRRSLVYPLSN